ncbi:MAG TPA: ABC transporter permease [Vicinamibacteria bacterium]
MSIAEGVHAAWRRWKALWWREQLDRDLQDELRFHLAVREEEYRAAGLDAAEARHAAARQLGNPVALKEECRDMWTYPRVETLWQDARFAGRVLRKSPGFTALAVLSLALGIGVNAAMFSVLSAVLLRPLPYGEADRLVRLTGSYPKGAVVALQERSRTMDVAGASADSELNLTGQGEAARLVGSTVSANLFGVLDRGAERGRAFETGDDRPGRDRVVVLSHALWESRFGGDAAVVGRTISVEGVDRQVVGVMPPGFHFPSASVQLWIPLRNDPSQTEDYWGFGWMPVVARLRPGATLSQAQDELRALRPTIAAMFPWPSPSWNMNAAVVPLQEDLVRDVRRKLLVLQSAVGIVLLIACVNVASLLLSRAAARKKEIALRAALGASRGRILRQLLTESVALAVVGGVLGVALARVTLLGLEAVLPADAREFSQVGVDLPALLFVTAVSVASGLFFGLAPALSASRVDLAASVKAGGQRGAGRAGARLRSSFIAAEVALAVVLAVGAGLFIRTLWGLTRVDPGFRPEQTLAVRVTPNPSTCQPRSACIALYDELLRRLRDLSGSSDVAAANALPLTGTEPLLPVELEGHPLATTNPVAPLVWAGAVTPSYFRVMRMPLLRGRSFDEADAERAARVVLVSAATARRYWPNDDPIGKRIRVVWDAEWRTVVGVVGDVRQYTLSGRSPADITGAVYMPYPQAVALNRQIPVAMSLLVRTTGDPSRMGAGIREMVASVNPSVPVGDAQTMEAVVTSSVSEPRSMMWLFASFAACSLLLAAIGTYGVVSYTTAQRTYEIGVRVAVGATRGDIFGLVIGQSLRLVLSGLAAGVVAALLLGRALSSFLYGVSAADPVTFAAVGALLVLTALLAGYVPGRRAANTDPVRALRVD